MQVFNIGKDGKPVPVPTRSGRTWVISKHKTIEKLNSDRFSQLKALRRLKSKSSTKGNEKVVFTKIYKTIETNVNIINEK